MIRWVFLVALFLCVPGFADAQATSTFTIQVFGSTDTIAPTTPTILSATPVTTSQIDLVWSTSTDNFTVFGYVVFRDSAAIATTTQLTYSDTGLTASTTYTYEVVAFDGVPNYSSTSAPVATTTPDIFVPPTVTDDSSQGTIARVILDTFDISVGVATATMDMTTNQVSRIEVRIGTTSSYEQMYIVGNQFKRQHEVFVNDLLPGTTYYYEVIGYTPSGVQTVLRQSSFTTGTNELPSPPTNVSNLTAVQQGDDVQLTYQLPADFPDDAVVRVVRSHLGFPQFLSDGVVVYEGAAEQVLDTSALRLHGRVFYTVFVIDPNGLVSSGAVISVTDNRTGVSPVSPTTPGAGEVTPGEGDSDGGSGSSFATTTDVDGTPIVTWPPATSSVIDLDGFPNLRDFIVEQGDLTFPFSSSTILLRGEAPFTVMVSADLITGDFKTMVATLSDPRDPDKTFSFLLRLNGDQTFYSAVLAPLNVAGASRLTIEVFDYDTKVIGRYETTLRFTAPEMASTTLQAWYWRVQTWLWALLLIVPVGVLLLLWFIFWKRDREEDEDNDQTQS